MLKSRILHITPHMGGGAGNVISGIASSSGGLHEIALLESPINKSFMSAAQDMGAGVFVQPDEKELHKLIEGSDVTIVHWWHHPKTARLLYHFPEVCTRLVIWTHISSLTAPALNPEILLRASMVWFTSPASYEANVFKEIPYERLMKKTRVVYGCPGLDDAPDIRHEPHDGFNIGYLGYVDFSKLHTEFILFCKAVEIAQAHFILAGEAPVKNILDRQARTLNMQDRFTYTGYVKNIYDVLSGFDVLGYPLMPFHTCTTENSVLEAMAARVPPVMLNQLSERYIVIDNETGLLVSGKEEYGNALRYLYQNPEKRKAMGRKARDYVLEKYSKKKLLDNFYSGVEDVMSCPKTKFHFRDILGSAPSQWFASCLGADGRSFRLSLKAGPDGQTPQIKKAILRCSPLLKGSSKASIFHYRREFPRDPMLKVWANTINEGSDDNE